MATINMTVGGKNHNLYAANRQWAERPADERFWSIDEALQVSKRYAESARSQIVDFGREQLLTGDDDNLVLTLDGGKGNDVATLTNYAFEQLCRTSKAPADYLRRLPGHLACQCLDAGMDEYFATRSKDNMDRNALVHVVEGGKQVVRSLTSEIYTRFWNYQVFERLAGLGDSWKVPPARPCPQGDPRARVATQADCLTMNKGGGGLTVKPGDLIAPAGIYASDHDMFAFLVNEEYRIDDGSDGGLSRGFFVSNSEVGDGGLNVTLFGYRSVCGNHIVWGASNVFELKVRHVGDVAGKFSVEMLANVREYLQSSAREDEARIKRAQRYILGTNEEEVLDSVFKLIIGKRKNGLPSGLNQKMLTGAYEMAIANEATDGNPRSLYGYINGLTRYSQVTPYADKRMFVDATVANLFAAV